MLLVGLGLGIAEVNHVVAIAICVNACDFQVAIARFIADLSVVGISRNQIPCTFVLNQVEDSAIDGHRRSIGFAMQVHREAAFGNCGLCLVVTCGRPGLCTRLKIGLVRHQCGIYTGCGGVPSLGNCRLEVLLYLDLNVYRVPVRVCCGQGKALFCKGCVGLCRLVLVPVAVSLSSGDDKLASFHSEADLAVLSGSAAFSIDEERILSRPVSAKVYGKGTGQRAVRAVICLCRNFRLNLLCDNWSVILNLDIDCAIYLVAAAILHNDFKLLNGS